MREGHIFLATLAFVSASPTLAQAPDTLLEDEIVVQGQIRTGDPAMASFFAGDFAAAEIAFERNILRIRRGRTEIESTSEAAISQNISGEAVQAVTQGSPSASGQPTPFSSPSSVVPAGARATAGERLVASGRDMGSQYYMAGLSELQLGKVDEAEESFLSAVRLNGTLHDARMRLALIRLGKGDVAYARKQHARLLKEVERCRAVCRHREEVEEAEAILGNILAQVR